MLGTAIVVRKQLSPDDLVKLLDDKDKLFTVQRSKNLPITYSRVISEMLDYLLGRKPLGYIDFHFKESFPPVDVLVNLERTVANMEKLVASSEITITSQMQIEVYTEVIAVLKQKIHGQK